MVCWPLTFIHFISDMNVILLSLAIPTVKVSCFFSLSVFNCRITWYGVQCCIRFMPEGIVMV